MPRAVVKRLRTLTAVTSSWSSQAFEYTVYADTRNDGQFDPFNMTLYDYYVRAPAVGAEWAVARMLACCMIPVAQKSTRCAVKPGACARSLRAHAIGGSRWAGLHTML